MITQKPKKFVGERVLYFGSRNVVLSGVITSIQDEEYIVKDDASRSEYRITISDILTSVHTANLG